MDNSPAFTAIMGAMQKADPLITPIILCGGSGTRLWPLSRKSYPKQFASLIGEESLFQASVRRSQGADFTAPVIVTGDSFRFIAREQLAAIDAKDAKIMIEPSGKNTAPAILAAALHAASANPNAILLVAPADHVVPDEAAFRAAVRRGLSAVTEGRLVTFGIAPSRPETGYGYLELSEKPNRDGAPVALSRFVEKPDAALAAEMIADGAYLWNAGIFLFSARDLIAAFERCAPEMVAPVAAAVDGAKADLSFLRLDPAAWEKVPSESIDYAVMEKAGNLSVVPYDGAWSDLGGWDAIWREGQGDAKGVVTSGKATAIDSENTLLRSESDLVEVVGIGLKNILTVAMPDAVLVADMSRAQDVKRAVDILTKRGVLQATQFPKDHRPWGWFESLVLGGRFQVKRISVHPGAALSLQSHYHRSEHWVVVEGTAKVTIGDKARLVTENESVYIPVGEKHRLENPGKVPVMLIEVQAGAYVGEDDIIRYEDVYARD
jgi:mannose-1-phosphate guanylyltransferase/mannose-6-phosphate isomerase